MNQVSEDKELLETARDYFCFVTGFFEPINVSATHIYHSALELSPLSSLTRRAYCDPQHPPLPRVIVGIQSWEQKITIHVKGYPPYTWSPCGQFIAVRNEDAVDIHDSLTLELLSTFKFPLPIYRQICQLAYSTDGHSIASLSDTSLTIWDIQTGGVANEICHGSDHGVSLLWSLDGSTIGIVGENERSTYAVYMCCIASGTMHPLGTLQSSDKPHLWAHGISFQILAAVKTSEGYAIRIFEIGSSLTEIKSFYIGSWEDSHIISFSPKMHHISIGSPQCFAILDIQNSDCLLRQEGSSGHHCFSSDGSLFAAHFQSSIQIWKYSPGCYTPWRKIASDHFSTMPQFSPTLPSLSYLSNGALYLWHLDDPLVGAHSDSYKPPAALSHCGGYTAVGGSDGTVTITNLSPAYSHIIDTSVIIESLALTGNVLLVWDSKTIMAWQLTKEGAVAGVSANERAGPGNAIWIILLSRPEFRFWDKVVTIRGTDAEGDVFHCYHPESGEVLELSQGIPLESGHWFSQWDIRDGRHNLYTYRPDPQHNQSGYGGRIPQDLKEGWVKGSGGKHQLWLPLEWRYYEPIGWSCNGRALRLGGREAVIIRL